MILAPLKQLLSVLKSGHHLGVMSVVRIFLNAEFIDVEIGAGGFLLSPLSFKRDPLSIAVNCGIDFCTPPSMGYSILGTLLTPMTSNQSRGSNPPLTWWIACHVAKLLPNVSNQLEPKIRESNIKRLVDPGEKALFFNPMDVKNLLSECDPFEPKRRAIDCPEYCAEYFWKIFSWFFLNCVHGELKSRRYNLWSWDWEPLEMVEVVRVQLSNDPEETQEEIERNVVLTFQPRTKAPFQLAFYPQSV